SDEDTRLLRRAGCPRGGCLAGRAKRSPTFAESAITSHVTSPRRRKALAERIRTSVLRPRELPDSGRVVPELDPRVYREVVVPPYRIIDALRAHEVLILRVWHGKRDLD